LYYSEAMLFPTMDVLPEYLAETNYRTPNDPFHTALQKGLKTDGDIMAFLGKNPEVAAATNKFLHDHRIAAPTWMDGSVPVKDFQLSAEDLNDGRVMLVDVGGGAGHQCFAFRKAFPQLKGKMVVQDVGFMINLIDKTAASEAGIEAMVHDFYTPQPVKGAKVYYLRTVLHDWNNERCQVILRQVREAMAKDSVVIIDEFVMPRTGATEKLMSSDLAMLMLVGAMERTRAQWEALTQSAGLKVRDVWIYNESASVGLVVAVPV
jgi:demethylsterigmatocystin 6-O-methyltransferase